MKYEFSGTPGPWFAVEYAGYWILQSFYESIDLLNEDNFEGGQAELNARLAAAAPDLLEALKDCITHISAVLSHSDVPESAVKAIHKALNI